MCRLWSSESNQYASVTVPGPAGPSRTRTTARNRERTSTFRGPRAIRSRLAAAPSPPPLGAGPSTTFRIERSLRLARARRRRPPTTAGPSTPPGKSSSSSTGGTRRRSSRARYVTRARYRFRETPKRSTCPFSAVHCWPFVATVSSQTTEFRLAYVSFPSSLWPDDEKRAFRFCLIWRLLLLLLRFTVVQFYELFFITIPVR